MGKNCDSFKKIKAILARKKAENKKEVVADSATTDSKKTKGKVADKKADEK